MAETVLAEKAAAGVLTGTDRIQVRNLYGVKRFLERLDHLLTDRRIIVFQLDDPDPIRTALLDYFTGDGQLDRELAFEAGWRSHATEIALIGGPSGLQAAGSLNPLKEPLREYLFSGTGSPGLLPGLLSSFRLGLPTVFVLAGYQGSPLFDDPQFPMPPVIALTDGVFALKDPGLVLDSGMISLPGIVALLKERELDIDPEEVFGITGGDEGLAGLYAGILSCTGIRPGTLKGMTSELFRNHADLAAMAGAAVVLAPGFVPAEAARAADLTGCGAHDFGRSLGLWKGFLVSDFTSRAVRELVRSILLPDGGDSIARACADSVISYRGRTSGSLALAGRLLLLSGDAEGASDLLEEAASKEERVFAASLLYRQAALGTSGERHERLLFLSDVCRYRSGLGELPGQVPPGMDLSGIPELDPAYQDARALLRDGNLHEGWIRLAAIASRSDLAAALALTEIGVHLLGRNMAEAAMNVARAAAIRASDSFSPWIESEALSVFVRACSRCGRFTAADRALERLMALALGSGCRRKLVQAYNLFANGLVIRNAYSSALRVYSSSLRSLDDDTEDLRTVILNNMSVAQRRLYRTDEALRSLMRMVRSTISAGNLKAASTAYGNMARLFLDLWRHGSASDCLESMVEFRKLAGLGAIDDSVLYISAQIAFQRGDMENAVSLMDSAVEQARRLGNLRRLSLNLVKKGSMLLRAGSFEEAAAVLEEAIRTSAQTNSMLNVFLADIKGEAARCMLGRGRPERLLSIPSCGDPDEAHHGERFYYHWKVTGSRQSMAAAAVLLSRRLSTGIHHHSYLHMVQEIASEIPASLADTLELVHNYPIP